MARRILRLARGDVVRWNADAITTSANAGLCGNATPSFWRFRAVPEQACSSAGAGVGRQQHRQQRSVPYMNVDGQVHDACGPELAAALASHCESHSFVLRHSAGASAPWRGAVLPQSTEWRVGCLAGCAVRTPAFGALRSTGASTIVHAVAPDGRHLAGSGRRYEQAAALLAQTYAAAIHEASEAGARSVAIPALGCGVNGFPLATATSAALTAAAAWLDGRRGLGLDRVDVVLSASCDQAWTAWRRVWSARAQPGLQILSADEAEVGRTS